MTTRKEKSRALKILKILEVTYPQEPLMPKAHTPLEYLIATMLSAQSTDVQVNKVTENLFKKYHTVQDYAAANPKELEQDIFTVGYYRQKTRHIQATCRMLIDDFDGDVPQTMENLLKLPGVGRKTANIVLFRAFGIVEGIAIDTHVFRISHRLGLSNRRNPTQVETDLIEILPREEWGRVNRLFIAHGRSLCTARNPQCTICPLNSVCPFAASLIAQG